MAVALCVAHAIPAAADWPDPALSYAEDMPKASRSLLLDAVALESGRLIAVGERGHVLLSDDDGQGWRQAVVPTRSTLAAIAASERNVVAVGHDGVILRSTDAGDSWQRVREEPYSPDDVASPSNGAPLLDVLFLDERRVLAVGAYSLMLSSEDGGATWQATDMTIAGDDAAAEPVAAADADAEDADAGDRMLFSDDDLMLEDEVDPHLNAIVRIGEDLLVVGERGTVFRSRDDGASWQRLSLSYGGSMFGALSLGDRRVLVFGLRGRAFESDDAGDSWRELDTGVQATLFGGGVGRDGTLVLAGAEGVVLRRAPEADRFAAAVFSTGSGETPVSSAVLVRDDGQLLLFGERGVAAWEARP